MKSFIFNKNIKNVIFYLALAVLCLYLSCMSIDYDYDLFARLIVGERFIEHGIFPFQDFLSYTPTHPWYDHEWGSGAIFYLFLKYIGPFGLILLHSILMFLTTVFIIQTQKLQKHAFPKSLALMSLFLFMYAKLTPSLRCHMFSFLFFSIFLYILEGTRLNKFKGKLNNLIWILPLITIFWNNVHGGVVSGLGLIAMYFVGAVIEKKPWKRYLAVLSYSTLSLLINPYGFKYLGFLFSATTKSRTEITEWFPFYHKHHHGYYIYTSIFSILGTIVTFTSFIKKQKVNITRLIIILTTTYLALSHVKLQSLSLIAITALCYNDIVVMLLKIKGILKSIEKCLYPVIFIVMFLIPLQFPFSAKASYYRYPLYEIEFLKINNLKGNIVVPFALGSYTTYKLYPNNLIYMDGRYEEVYYDKEFTVLRQWETAKENWTDIVNNYPTDIIMPYKKYKISELLEEDPNWTPIFEGKICTIFVKKGTEKDSYKEPEHGLGYYRKTMFNHGDFKND